jgi:hypothetical protein
MMALLRAAENQPFAPSPPDSGTLNLIPWPKSVTVGPGVMRLSPDSRIVAAGPTLKPLA